MTFNSSRGIKDWPCPCLCKLNDIKVNLKRQHQELIYKKNKNIV